MTNAGIRRKERGISRVTASVPTRVTTFLDVVCKHSPANKVTLYRDIWAAGVQQIFGISFEELDECEITLPSPDAALPTDLKALTNVLCGE